jgi:hypothetical protein
MADRGEGAFLNLQRVIRAQPQTGPSIRILALEIYDMGFALRWALPSGPGSPPETAEEAQINPFGLMSLTLRDDLHTRYELAGMFSGATLGGVSGGVSFYKPAIPEGASWLEVLVKDGFVRFELQPTQ